MTDHDQTCDEGWGHRIYTLRTGHDGPHVDERMKAARDELLRTLRRKNVTPQQLDEDTVDSIAQAVIAVYLGLPVVETQPGEAAVADQYTADEHAEGIAYLTTGAGAPIAESESAFFADQQTAEQLLPPSPHGGNDD